MEKKIYFSKQKKLNNEHRKSIDVNILLMTSNSEHLILVYLHGKISLRQCLDLSLEDVEVAEAFSSRISWNLSAD